MVIFYYLPVHGDPDYNHVKNPVHMTAEILILIM